LIVSTATGAVTASAASVTTMARRTRPAGRSARDVSAGAAAGVSGVAGREGVSQRCWASFDVWFPELLENTGFLLNRSRRARVIASRARYDKTARRSTPHCPVHHVRPGATRVAREALRLGTTSAGVIG
jgi:hypothetical protein